MLTFTRSYQTSDGACHATLAGAQAAEIASLLEISEPQAAVIVEKKDEILAILTITDNSRPRARGVPKKRKPKTDAAPAELPIPQ